MISSPNCGSATAPDDADDRQRDLYAHGDRGDPGRDAPAPRRSRADQLAEAGARLRAAQPVMVATIARGSSDHAAAYLKYAIELIAGVPVASIGPSIMSIYGRELQARRAAPPSPSRSRARAPTSSRMAQSARRNGALGIALTNTAGSPLAAAADLAIDLHAGVENSRSPPPRASSARSSPAWRCSAHWTERRGAARRRSTTCPTRSASAVACDWSPLLGGARGPQLALCPRPRPGARHRRRGGAEIQGNLRHPRRGL